MREAKVRLREAERAHPKREERGERLQICAEEGDEEEDGWMDGWIDIHTSTHPHTCEKISGMLSSSLVCALPAPNMEGILLRM